LEGKRAASGCSQPCLEHAGELRGAGWRKSTGRALFPCFGIPLAFIIISVVRSPKHQRRCDMDEIHLTITAILFITVCFAGTAAADKNSDRTTYDILNQTWNIDAWDDSSDITYSVMTIIEDVDYLNSDREDLIFNPTNAMFDRADFYFKGNINNGTLPEDESLPITLVLSAVILGSMGITLFVWFLDKRKYYRFYIIPS
jgi:hypothetical protein